MGCILALPDPSYCLFGVAFGQCGLVGRRLDRFALTVQGEGKILAGGILDVLVSPLRPSASSHRAIIVAADEPEEMIEALFVRMRDPFSRLIECPRDPTYPHNRCTYLL